MRSVVSAILVFSLGGLLTRGMVGLDWGNSPMQVGQTINQVSLEKTGSSNVVTAVVLAFRGMDTLGELTILFIAITSIGLIGGTFESHLKPSQSAFITQNASRFLLPFLMMIGIYIILHGHLTPGGGFQGGAVIAGAFFLAWSTGIQRQLNQIVVLVLESLAGICFISIGLMALLKDQAFLTPLWKQLPLGDLFSAGSIPLLYTAVGVKVATELAGLLWSMSGFNDNEGGANEFTK